MRAAALKSRSGRVISQVPRTGVLDSAATSTAAVVGDMEAFWKSCARNWSAQLSSSGAKATVANTFWGENGALTLLVRILAANFPGYSTFIDAGAGEYSFYNDAGAVVFEGSNAMQFYRLWSKPQHSVTVLAFEPNADNPVYNKARRTMGQVLALPLVLTNHTGHVTLRGTGNIGTINERLLVHPHFKNRKTRLLNASTADAMARAHLPGRLDVLKTDTEGADWEVILGATQLLSDSGRRPHVLIIAYEDKWSVSTYFAAYPLRRRSRSRLYEARRPRDMVPPTLRSVSAHLFALQYSSYLIGSAKTHWQRQRQGCDAAMQFVPVSPPYWDDSFELAFRPLKLGLKFSWFDVIAVVTGSNEERLLQRLAACGGGAPVCGGAV